MWLGKDEEAIDSKCETLGSDGLGWRLVELVMACGAGLGEVIGWESNGIRKRSVVEAMGWRTNTFFNFSIII